MRPLSAVGLLLSVAACQGATERDCYVDAASCVDEAGTDRGYVIDDVILPTDDDDAADIALDLDGNGTVDNRLGEAMATFAIQPEVDLRLRRGGQ